jgi:hypothetical protein
VQEFKLQTGKRTQSIKTFGDYAMRKYLKFISVFVALSIIPLLFIGSSHIIINSINKKVRKNVKQHVEQYLVKKLQQLVEQGFERQQIEQQLVEKGFELEPQQIEQYFEQQHIELTEEQLDANVQIAIDLAREEPSIGIMDHLFSRSIPMNIVKRADNLNQYSFYTKVLTLSALFSALLVCLFSSVSNVNRLFLLIFKIVSSAAFVISSILILSQSILLAGAIYYLIVHFAKISTLYLSFPIVVSLGMPISLGLIVNMFEKMKTSLSPGILILLGLIAKIYAKIKTKRQKN